MAHLGEETLSPQTSLAPQDHDPGLFAEPKIEQEFIPAPKLFQVQNQWVHPGSFPTPCGNDKRFYNMGSNLAQALQLPTVDGPVAALSSPSPYLSGDIAEGLRAEDKKAEYTLRKVHQAAAWAIKASTAASFFTHTSLIWLHQLQSRVAPREACLHQDLNKLIAATQFSADAMLNAAKYASRALSSSVTSRRLL